MHILSLWDPSHVISDLWILCWARPVFVCLFFLWGALSWWSTPFNYAMGFSCVVLAIPVLLLAFARFVSHNPHCLCWVDLFCLCGNFHSPSPSFPAEHHQFCSCWILPDDHCSRLLPGGQHTADPTELFPQSYHWWLHHCLGCRSFPDEW